MLMTSKEDTELDALQKLLDHRFKDVTLLTRAITHSSLSAGGNVRDLERLEFLGDRVLGLMVAEELWRRFPDLPEGELAPRLNALVRKETCAKAAESLQIGSHIRLSTAEAQAGGREKTAILGDVCEALFGALYIDGGLAAAGKIFAAYWLPNFGRLTARWKDAKTELQEWAQHKTGDAPDYHIVTHDGPAHQPEFVIDVAVAGYQPARGKGGSKRNAQMAAAKSFLLREKIWSSEDAE